MKSIMADNGSTRIPSSIGIWLIVSQVNPALIFWPFNTGAITKNERMHEAALAKIATSALLLFRIFPKKMITANEKRGSSGIKNAQITILIN